MKTLIALLVFVSTAAVAADLSNQTALEGKNEGRRCREVVTEALRKHLNGGPVKLLTYEGTTQGSFDQEFIATFTRGTARVHTAELSGKYDCDSLKVQSIR